MARTRNRKVDAEVVPLGAILRSLNVKQAIGIISIVAIVLSTAYGFGYTSAQKAADLEMKSHIIDDKEERLKNQQLHIEKESELKKYKTENEELRNKISTHSEKERALILVVPKKGKK
jgi:hypothetical protein